MGGGFSHLLPCVNPEPAANRAEPESNRAEPEVLFTGEPLDETLGHSFCYVRSSNRFVSPPHSDRFISPSNSLRFDETNLRPAGSVEPAGFRSISGASVSANTATPRTVLQVDEFYEDANAVDGGTLGFGGGTGVRGSVVNGFESSLGFMSGPIERGALSGPLEVNTNHNLSSNAVPFSAPLSGGYVGKKRRRRRRGISNGISSFRNALVLPVRQFVGRKERETVAEMSCDGNVKNVQWALGKAGEDRVHVVVSEEHGWLFVGIYDGFNGPDAPEFLMSNLYKAMYKKLEGLFWDSEETSRQEQEEECGVSAGVENSGIENVGSSVGDRGSTKKVTFQSGEIAVRRKRLWELLAEDDTEDGLDLSGSDRFAFSVEDAISVKNEGSAVRRSLLLSKLKHGLMVKHRDKKLFPWRFGLKGKEKVEVEENRVEEERSVGNGRRRRVGPVDHELVLRAMAGALEVTELAYLDMTDKLLDRYPELALMGSCLLVALMRDEDVYVMNVGDSRAIVAKYEHEEVTSSSNPRIRGDDGLTEEGIAEESKGCIQSEDKKLIALQLSTDHSTSIEEEVIRIKNEHPDDSNCIVNDRVKGRLKVTRAFGAGFLKQRKLNDALLEMFRNDYIGNNPYISCTPSLRHHRLCPGDQFLVLSSDGLYQYLTNEEVVSHVANFMEKFPEGDPAQHLIEELLLRAAKKAGMELHELLDIPKGDRRKYHDDVTVMVISLEGRIWKSSGKYL